MTTAEEARRVLARRVLERRRAKADPLYLVSFMSAVDQRDGSRFTFEHLREPLKDGEVELVGNKLVRREKNWRWQRHLAERLLEALRLICLKGRQIGATWDVLAVDVAEAITIPGSASLLYRQREDDAVDNIRRWWVLYQSLPSHFKEGIKVVKPDISRAPQPGRDGVSLLFPDGAISEIIPMTSAASSGHGRSVRRVIVDEAAYIEKFEQIRAAIEPAAGRAKITVISTANGRSNPETGEGNEFHRLWAAEGSGYERIFLPFDLHPDRDENWYETAPEVQSLKVHQRNAQFPRDEHEAFALTSRTFFDPDDLREYGARVIQPSYRFDFERKQSDVAKLKKRSDGMIRVYSPPEEAHKYAIGADVATGRGADYSAAYVIDLSSMELVAEFHGKIDADLYAFQLHYLGKLYNTAWIAIETGGGYGEAVIIPLRDGREGRPPYPRLYRHVLSSRPDLPLSKPFGFPTNSKTRPLILNQLEKAVREKTLPFVSDALLWEMESFVYHDHGTSPRAQEGARDDLVMASAIALEMYRLYGEHAERKVKKAKSTYRPWLKLGNAA